MFRTLVEKINKYQIGPSKYHWKGFEVQMPKVPLHCSFRIEMHEVFLKEKLGVKLEI
jgi:hypothetical protein